MLNYKNGFEPLLFLMVIPQFIGGAILAYTRLRVGLGAAVLMHASTNGLAVLLVLSNA
jgi:membrane protease YdiL (CAAX protease family)